MAEAIGLAASIATILHVARKIEEYGRDYYTAQDQQDELGRTLKTFKIKVNLLEKHGKRALDNPTDDRFEALRAVLKSSIIPDSEGANIRPDPGCRNVGALKQIRKGMEETETSLSTLRGKSAKSKIKRLVWHHNKKGFHEIIGKIDVSIRQVESVLAYDHYAIDLDTSEGVRKLLKQQEVETEASNERREKEARVQEVSRRDDTEKRRREREEQAQATEILRQEIERSRREVAEERQRAAREREQEVQERKRIAIINWLSPLSFQARQSELYNQCSQQNISTPEFFKSLEFEAWTSGSPWRLRCVGEPGVGKTLLCAQVIGRLKDIFKSRNVAVLCIYLNYKESFTQTLDNLISCLLKQLLQNQIREFKSPEAKRLFSGVENESRPTLEEFFKALVAEIRRFERVMIVVDAFDEASTAVKNRLLHLLMSLPREKVSLMITSRPIDDEPLGKFCDSCGRGKSTHDMPTATPLTVYHHCDICDHDICPSCMENGAYCKDRKHILKEPEEVRMDIRPTEKDLKLYVEIELETELQLGSSKQSKSSITGSSFGKTSLGEFCRRRPDLQERIIPTVILNANSMFTLAGLYIQTLKACTSEAEVEDALNEPPDGYDGFYERNMLRITEESENPRTSKLALKTLQWVVSAQRPLSLAELQDALAVNPDNAGFRKSAKPYKATILEVTAGMIIIDLDEKSVRLNHRTAQEYFDKSRERWFVNASADITRVSLHYMSLGELAKPCEGIYEDREFDRRKKEYPLLEYVCVYWGDHAYDAGPHLKTQAAVFDHVREPSKVAAWTQAAWYLRSVERAEWDIRKGANALHVCAWFGLTDVVSKLLDDGLNINVADPNYKQTPLMYACRRGHSATVAELLKRGADVNQYSLRDSVALFEAVDSGDVETVELLLSHEKLDVNAIHPRRFNRTALMLAAQSGKLEIVSALVDQHGIKLDQQDLEGNNALSLATMAGQYDIVEALLDHGGIAIDSKNRLGSTALILAATPSVGQKENASKIDIARILLDQDADTSIKDHEGGGTALMRAVDADNGEMVELLFDYDADVNVRDDLDRGLLHSAAIDGYEGIVRLLLEKDLDINCQDQNGKTPLHDAGRNGNYKVAELLRDSGANLSIKDKYGRIPWTVAWQYGNLNVMRVLERQDILVDSRVKYSSYPNVDSLPMWSIANLGLERAVEDMIVHKPHEIYHCDPDLGNTPLHWAVSANKAHILTRLLDAGLSPSAQNDYHRTPLHLAALAGHTQLITTLLQHATTTTTIDSKDKWLETPLTMAYHNRHLDSALILITAGATIPTSQSAMIQRLFLAGVESGDLPAVKRLIALGADLSAKNVLGQTALQIAKEGGKDEIVQILRANKSVFRSPRVGFVKEEEEEEEEEEEKMAMLSIKESPFHKPEVWNEEEEEEEEIRARGERAVVAPALVGAS